MKILSTCSPASATVTVAVSRSTPSSTWRAQASPRLPVATVCPDRTVTGWAAPGRRAGPPPPPPLPALVQRGQPEHGDGEGARAAEPHPVPQLRCPRGDITGDGSGRGRNRFDGARTTSEAPHGPPAAAASVHPLVGVRRVDRHIAVGL